MNKLIFVIALLLLVFIFYSKSYQEGFKDGKAHIPRLQVTTHLDGKEYVDTILYRGGCRGRFCIKGIV